MIARELPVVFSILRHHSQFAYIDTFLRNDLFILPYCWRGNRNIILLSKRNKVKQTADYF